MRHFFSISMLGAALCLGALSAAQAATVPATAPVSTMSYSIGSLSRALQFMGDGSVRLACDGSVLVACDGSVTPIGNVAAAVAGDGSVRLLTPITMFGDGSVRAGDGSVAPSDLDTLVLSALGFSPNPFIALGLSVFDFGAATNFLVTVSGPLLLGATDYTYELSGAATLTDGATDGVSMGAVSVGGSTGLVFGLVDGSVVDAIGAGGLSSPGLNTLPSASGAGSCAACAVQGLAVGFQGSGGGDLYGVSARFDLTAASAVPEPRTLGLVAAGLMLLGWARRRR